MTFPAPKPEERIQPVQPGMDEALEHLRASAEILRTIGSLSTSEVPDILQEISIEKATDEQKKNDEAERKSKAGEVQETLYEFVKLLPHAVTGTRTAVTGKYNVDTQTYENPIKTHNFESPSIDQLRIAETQVWWVPAMAETDHDSLRYRDFAIEDTPPYFVIGERPVMFKKDKSDARIELLLIRASDDADLQDPLRVQVSSKLRDMADKIAMEELRSPLDRSELERFYLSPVNGSYRLSAPNGTRERSNARLIRVIDSYQYGTQEPVARSEQSRLIENDAYWEKRRRSIAKKGLTASLDNDYRYKRGRPLSLEEIDEFNVPFHARKLAILLGDEAAYDKTVGAKLAELQPEV
jgi:hypothetical protein